MSLTVIIPPTDVSPTTGTGNAVLATSPTLTTPISATLTSPAATNLTLAGGAGNSSIILTPAGTGGVGIGTTTPTGGQLEIKGNSDGGSFPNRPRLALTNEAGTAVTWSIQPWSTSGDANLSIHRSGSTGNILLAPSGGNVGIGTTTPSQKLSVNGTMQWAQTADAGYSGYLTNASTNAAYNPAITRNLIGSTDSTYTIAHGDMDAYAGIQFGISGTSTNAGNISFFAASGSFATNQSVTPVARMFIADTGDVSISSTTAGSSGVGALVVAGGLAAAGASYFGGAVTAMIAGTRTGINDDSVASFTPLVIGGVSRGFFIILNSDYSESVIGSYFSSGGSYYLYPVVKSANVTLTNSTTMTGTTGTDGKMNIGFNNGIIYIENRLGGTGNFLYLPFGGTT